MPPPALSALVKSARAHKSAFVDDIVADAAREAGNARLAEEDAAGASRGRADS